MVEQTEELRVGRELDRAVAERVMGFTGVGYYGPTKSLGTHQDYRLCETAEEAKVLFDKFWLDWTKDPQLCWWKDGWGPVFVSDYSTDIAAAFEVVEELMKDWTWHVQWQDRGPWVGYTVQLFRRKGDGIVIEGGDTAPEAICRAALKVEGE